MNINKALVLWAVIIIHNISYGEIVSLPDDESIIFRPKLLKERLSIRCKFNTECQAKKALNFIQTYKKKKNVFKGGKNPLSVVCHLSKGKYVIIKLFTPFESLSGENYFCQYEDKSFILAGDLLDAFYSN